MGGLILPNGKLSFSDANGFPLIGGKVSYYEPGTFTPKDTFQNVALTTLNTNPIVLDARGEASVYGMGAYRQIVRDAANNLIWDQVIPDVMESINTAVAALYAGSIYVVNSIAELKAVSKTMYKNVLVTGYYAKGDGGGGNYFLDATDIVSTDDGGSIIVGSDGGRWKLIYYRSMSLRQFGAKMDGTTDDTAAVQKAINSAVFHLTVPATAKGARLTGPITFLNAKRIEGSGFTNYDATGPFNRRGAGSWFFLDHTGVGIKFGNGPHASIIWMSGVGTYRNQPAPVTGVTWTPVDADFDIDIQGTDVVLKDIMNLNATRGIRINTPVRVEMDGIRGQYFKNGLYVQKANDVVRVNNRQSWPYWSNSDEVTAYTKANLNDIALERIDIPQFNNCFSIYSLVGIGFYQNTDGTCSNGMFENMSFDGCGTCIYVDAGVKGATAQFTNTTLYGPVTPALSSKGVTLQGIECRFEFANLEGANLSNGLLEIFGTTNTVTVSAVRAIFWNLFTAGAAMLNCNGPTNTLNIIGPLNTSGTPGTPNVLNGTGLIRYPGSARTGQATIPALSTTVLVTHEQPIIPQLNRIQLTPLSALGTARTAYVSAATATTFTITLEAATSAPVLIGWRCALD